MSTFTIDTATSRATPTPVPGKRMTVPAIRGHKAPYFSTLSSSFSSARIRFGSGISYPSRADWIQICVRK